MTLAPPDPRGRVLRDRGAHPGRDRRRGPVRRLPATDEPVGPASFGRDRDGRPMSLVEARPGPPPTEPGPTAESPAGSATGRRARPPRDWTAIRLVMGKDLRAVRRSKAIMLPMIIVPTVLLIILPVGLGLFARSAPTTSVQNALDSPLLHHLAGPIAQVARPRADRRAGARLPAVAAAAGHPAHGLGRAGRRRVRRREGAAHARGPAAAAHQRPGPLPGQGARRLRARPGHHHRRVDRLRRAVQRDRLAGDPPARSSRSPSGWW